MKKNVLVIDDFENSLFVTGMTIQSAGYEIFKANSAKKAIEILKSDKKIDLIVTDYNMPEMNGLQFIQTVKNMFGNTPLPIFVLSTESKDEIKKAALAAGASLWLRKPFNTQQLIEYIKRALGV